MAGITSHFKTLGKQIYQTLTKTNIFVNQQVQEVRENNELSEGDFKNIIDLDRTTILSNIQKLIRMIYYYMHYIRYFLPVAVIGVM